MKTFQKVIEFTLFAVMPVIIIILTLTSKF